MGIGRVDRRWGEGGGDGVGQVKVELNGGGRMRYNLMRLVWQFVETH